MALMVETLTTHAICSLLLCCKNLNISLTLSISFMMQMTGVCQGWCTKCHHFPRTAFVTLRLCQIVVQDLQSILFLGCQALLMADSQWFSLLPFLEVLPRPSLCPVLYHIHPLHPWLFLVLQLHSFPWPPRLRVWSPLPATAATAVQLYMWETKNCNQKQVYINGISG